MYGLRVCHTVINILAKSSRQTTRDVQSRYSKYHLPLFPLLSPLPPSREILHGSDGKCHGTSVEF
jgi:hypothetical protein